MPQKITTFLWFDTQAEDAANFYCSIFKNSKITQINRYGKAVSEASGQPEGSVMVVVFQLEGQEFIALNGGPMFKFSEAISLMVSAETQGELDEINAKLISGGGEQGPCGWLRDKYGLSWQVAPASFFRLMQEADPERQERIMAAVMEMTKFDIAAIENA